MISIEEHLNHVGRLFYAIAICDGNLHEQELITLQEALTEYKETVVARSSFAQSSKNYAAEKVITSAREESKDSWANFTEFKKYYEVHRNEFSRELKDHILTSINRIASSYSKQNKSEIVLLAKTRLLFNHR